MFTTTVPRLLLFGALALVVLCSPALGTPRRVARLASANGSQNGASPDESGPPETMLQRQMLNPSEILSVLQIIGGDVIQKAIAQLSGTRLRFTPVAFSFGWVAYTFNAVMAVFGDGILMPRPEDEVIVVNLQSGTKKRNESWVLWRLVRDLELLSVSEAKSTVRIFWFLDGAGKPSPDVLTWLFVVFLPAQLVIAAIPWWREGNWLIFAITMVGTFLATVTGSLPQWRKERYDARPSKENQGYILTRGNGHLHSFTFIAPPGADAGLRLEDMAIVRPDHVKSLTTRIMMPLLAVCWILLLMTVGGLERDTWYLFSVGALGMVQNLAAAGIRRDSGAHGIPVREAPMALMQGNKTMGLLQEAEWKFPGVGLRLLDIYFSSTMLDEEEREYWKRMQDSLDSRKKVFLGRSRTLNDMGGLANILHSQLGNGGWALTGALVSPTDDSAEPPFPNVAQGGAGNERDEIELSTVPPGTSARRRA